MKNTIYLLLIGVLIYSCSPKIEDEMDIGPKPQADFAIDKSNPNYVKFSNTSAGTFMQKWDFGNGQSSTEKNPTAYYPFAGEFVVTLTVNSKGGMAVTEKKVSVAVGDPAVCQDTMYMRLTGGCDSINGKTWVLDTAKGASGVGQPDGNTDNWFSAAANQFNLPNVTDPCIYENEFVFTLKGAVYENRNKGASLYNWDYANHEKGFNLWQYYDTCIAYTPKVSNWSLVKENGNYYLNLSDEEFIAYYEGRSKYQVMKLTDNELYIRHYFGYKVDTGWRYWRLVPKK